MKHLFFFLLLLFPYAALHAQWVSANGPEGGIVYDVQRVGTDLWAGTEGGLYVSKDNGASWERSLLIAPEDNVRAISVYPNEILLGVTHWTNNSGTADPQILCYRSTDSGATFAQSEMPLFNWDGNINRFSRQGNALYCHAEERWVYSLDNALTWEPVPLPDSNYYARSFAVSGKRMLFADYYTLWSSEDAGVNWSFVDSIPYITSLYLEGNLAIMTTYDSLYRSTDFAATWQPVAAGTLDISGLQRGNQNELWLAGSNILRSFDDGLTWQTQSFTPPSNEYLYAGPGIQDGSEYILSAHQGVLKSADGKWAYANKGLYVSKVYAMQPDGQNGMFAFTNVGNFHSASGGSDWTKLPYTPYPAGPGAIISAVSIGSTMFVSDDDRIWKTTDQGQTWTNITPGPNFLQFSERLVVHDGKVYAPNYKDIVCSSDLGATWQHITIAQATYGWFDDIVFVDKTALVIDNDGGVWRSDDENLTTWTMVHEFFSPGAHNGNRLMYFNNTLYAFGRIINSISTDGGLTWKGREMQGVPLDSWGDPMTLTNHLAVDNLLFATIPYNGVYVSSDGGSQWEAFNDGLGNLRGRYLALSDNKTLYLGTSTGGVYKRGSQFQSVSGTVYGDSNNNGQQDNGEQPLQGIIVAAEPLHSYTSSGASGSFGLLAESFSDTIRAVLPSPYATVNPPFYVASQSGSAFHFGIHYTPGIKDLCVSATNVQVIRPGFESRIIVTVKNVGTAVSAPATAQLVLPEGLEFAYSDPFASQSGDTLTWQLGTLPPLSSKAITVTVNCAISLPLDQSVAITATISPLTGDANPSNNTYRYNEIVVGSYDPNDKRVRPEKVTPAQIASGQRLEYTVRFENTGSFYADFVRILDTLDESLDASSLQVIAASHSMTWTLRGRGIVEFVFKDIFLLPSSFGNGEGHGFVQFSVGCRKGLPLNTVIPNTAHIFFDFNPAITTNTAQTAIKEFVSVGHPFTSGPHITVLPNPAVDHIWVQWSAQVPEGQLSLYNAKGQLVLNQAVPAASARRLLVQLPALPVGQYQLEWRDAAQASATTTMLVISQN